MHRNNRGPIPLWQLALYIAMLGIVALFLAPLTALWWIVPLLGTALPVLLAFIQRGEHRDTAAPHAPQRSGDPPLRAPETVAPPGSREIDAPDTGDALGTGVSATATPLPAPESGLSERELEVLALLAAGKTNAEAAAALSISVGTVKSHSANIYRKLDARNRTEAVARAREIGLLE